MKNVMKRAWEIAREGVKKFGGKVKEYFAEALKMAWAEFKKGVKKVSKSEAMRKMKKAVKEFRKEFFDGYIAHMESKGVKVKRITSDSANLVAPNGITTIAYADVPQGRKINDDVYEYDFGICFEYNGKLNNGGVKTVRYKLSDFAN